MLSRRSNFSAQDFIYLFNYIQSSSEAVLDSGHINLFPGILYSRLVYLWWYLEDHTLV
jgi:hypothetical protein